MRQILFRWMVIVYKIRIIKYTFIYDKYNHLIKITDLCVKNFALRKYKFLNLINRSI